MYINHERRAMSHFTEGVLQAYLDDEVTADARAQVRAHVGACTACAARLQELREFSTTFANALQATDVSAIPAAALAELQMRANRHAWADRWARSRHALLRAALVVIGITAVTAVGAQVWETLQKRQVQPTQPAQAPVVEEVPPPRFAITPKDGRVRIILQGLNAGTNIHVLLTDEDKPAVYVVGEKKFRTAAGEIEVIGGSGDVRVWLPRALVAASVEVDGRVFVTKDAGNLRVLGTTSERVGDELIFTPAR
jgi:hypothetical protein